MKRASQSTEDHEARTPPGHAAPLHCIELFGRVVPLVAVVLITVMVIAYLPAVRGDFVWDDDDYVTNNQTLRSAEGLRSIWLVPSATPQYYPLVHTSYWLEYRLWGLRPLGYHITNLALHIVSVIVLWRVLLLLSIPSAWLIAAIFAVHPVQVESVAWITERKNVLSGVFYLLSMLAYLNFAFDNPDHGKRGRRVVLYAAACTFFLFALLSKSVTATLPAALLVLIVWKRGHLQPRDVWSIVPFFVVGVPMGLMTAWIEKYQVGAGIGWHLTPLERCIVAGHAVWFYASKLIWPTNLTFIYPKWHIDATDPLQLVYPLAAIATIAALWLSRQRIGSGPIVALLLFAGTLVPALGFFDVFPMRYSFVADHFQYLASIGLIALVVGAGVQVMQRLAPVHPFASHAIVWGLIFVLALLTWRQCHIYADQETLWRDTIAKDPGSWMGHTALGALLGRRGDNIDAETHYREAVRLNPDFGIARLNLGGLLANEGRFDEAIPQMREDVRLEPYSLEAYVSLARALLLDGQPKEAMYWIRIALITWPNDDRLRRLLEAARSAQ